MLTSFSTDKYNASIFNPERKSFEYTANAKNSKSEHIFDGITLRDEIWEISIGKKLKVKKWFLFGLWIMAVWNL